MHVFPGHSAESNAWYLWLIFLICYCCTENKKFPLIQADVGFGSYICTAAAADIQLFILQAWGIVLAKPWKHLFT